MVKVLPCTPVTLSTPLFAEVSPVCASVPVSESTPPPVLLRLPEVTALAPDIVKVAAEFTTSMLLVFPAVSVKLRSVVAPAPVYCSVPPSSARFAAALADAPSELLAPPFAKVLIASVPALIVVAPV